MRPLSPVVVFLALATVAWAATPNVRWAPSGAFLDRDGAVALTLYGGPVSLATDLREARVHLRPVHSGEIVPLERMTEKDQDADGNPVLIFYPTESLAPSTTYVFETRGPTLRLSRIYRTRTGFADRLPAGTPRFRRVRGEPSRFHCVDLEKALRVEVELERGAAEDDGDDDWHEEHFTRWSPLGTYLLEPHHGGRGGSYVDLADLVGERDSAPHRLRFRLIGWDAFRGRASGWRILSDS